jgi:hypothetical protein
MRIRCSSLGRVTYERVLRTRDPEVESAHIYRRADIGLAWDYANRTHSRDHRLTPTRAYKNHEQCRPYPFIAAHVHRLYLLLK